jgi:hypothetical protein
LVYNGKRKKGGEPRDPIAIEEIRRMIRKALMFLQLSLLACTTASALSAEQEMEAKAREIMPLVFSKCGEDYFSKRTMSYRSGGESYVLAHYKVLTYQIKPQRLLTTDPANGVEWKAIVQFKAVSAREYTHGMQFSTGGLNPKAPQNDTWSDWKKPNLAAYTFYIEKRNVVVNSKRRTPQYLNPVPCSETPK